MKIEDKEELYSRLRLSKIHSLLGIHNLGVIIHFFTTLCLLLLGGILISTLPTEFHSVLLFVLISILITGILLFNDFIRNTVNKKNSFIVGTIRDLNTYNSMISAVKIGDFNKKEINKQFASCVKLIRKYKSFYGGKADQMDGIIDIMYNTYKNTNYTVTVIKKYANTHVRDEFIVLIAFEEKIDIKEAQNSFLEQKNIKVWGKGNFNTKEKYIILNKEYKYDKMFVLSNYTKESYFKRFDDIENLYQNIITYAEKVIDENE